MSEEELRALLKQLDSRDKAREKRIVEAFESRLEPSDEHRAHHEFLRRRIAMLERREARWRRIQERVAGWAIIGVLGAVGAGAWKLVSLWIHPPPPPP